MAVPTQSLVETLLKRHGRLYAEELGISVTEHDRPSEDPEPKPPVDQSPLSPDHAFQLLSAIILLCGRAPWATAVEGFHGLEHLGWGTAAEAVKHPPDAIAKALAEAGFPAGTETEIHKIAQILHDLSEKLLEKYEGNLNALRAEAGEDPRVERRALKDLAGVSDVCVDTFFREMQAWWPELFPFADERARRSAAALGFPKSAATLSRLVKRQDFPRFIAALVRAEVAGDHQQIRKRAAHSS